MKYVDGFVLVVQKKNFGAYKRWQAGKLLTFPKMTKLKKGELSSYFLIR